MRDHKLLEVVAVDLEEAAEVEEIEAPRNHSDQTPADKSPPTRMASKSTLVLEEVEIRNTEERMVTENPAWEEVP